MNFSKINLNLYKAFVAVYDFKSITTAANILNFTQPAITKHIKELEEQLGAQLFITHSRGVEPTIAANELYKIIQPAFFELNRGEDIVREINELSTGELSFSCNSHISCFVILEFICDFRKQYPNVKLKIYSAAKNETLEMLLKRNIEFVIDVLPIDNNAMEITTLLELPYSFYTSKGFLEKNELNQIISKSDLEKYPIIVPAKTSRTMRSLMKKLKIDLNVMIEATTSELGYNMVLNGCGIGHTLEMFLDGNYRKDEIVKLKLKDAELPSASLVYACYENSVSKTGKMFLKGLKEYCQKLGA